MQTEAKTQEMEKPLYEASGQVQGIVGGVVALIAGMGVATLVLIFVGVLGGQTYNLTEDDINSVGYSTVSNENHTFLNDTAVALNNNPIDADTVTLAQGSTELTSSQFAVDETAGTITLQDATYNNTQLNATYDWLKYEDIQTSIKDGVKSGFQSIEQTGNYLPIIVLAIVITIVLSLVIGMTALTGGGGMGGRSAL